MSEEMIKQLRVIAAASGPIEVRLVIPEWFWRQYPKDDIYEAARKLNIALAPRYSDVMARLNRNWKAEPPADKGET